MSQYASVEDFLQLGLPPRATKNIQAEVITRFLVVASGKVDSYLRSKHTLPLTGALGPPNTYPDEIVYATICLARYKLLIWRGYSPDEFDNEYRAAMEDCMRWLKELATGKASLDDAADATPLEYEGRPRVSTIVDRQWHAEQDAVDAAAQNTFPSSD